MENNNLIIDIIKKYTSLYNSEKAKKSYNFNILEEQQGHIVENSHSSILLKLLAYKNQYGYVFLQDFCQRFVSPDLKIPESCDGICFDKERFYQKDARDRQNSRIDCLIYKKNDFAIIIENKINRAGNQGEQLKRYIVSVLDDKEIFDNTHEDNKKKIWVVFLTRDGVEMPDNGSKEYLLEKFYCKWENDDLSGSNYSPINYAQHLLPWIKESVMPIVPYKETNLYYGLCQYADYLDGILGNRKTDQDFLSNVRDMLNSSLDKKNYSGKDKNRFLLKLYNEISERKRKDENKISKNTDEEKEVNWDLLLSAIERYNQETIKDIVQTIKDIIEDRKDDDFIMCEECRVQSDFSFKYIFVHDIRWSKYVHFEWTPTNLFELNKTKTMKLYFHVEHGGIQKRFEEEKTLKEKVEKTLKEKGFEKDKNRSKSLSYDKEFNIDKPLLNMKKGELYDFLSKAYKESISKELWAYITEFAV